MNIKEKGGTILEDSNESEKTPGLKSSQSKIDEADEGAEEEGEEEGDEMKNTRSEEDEQSERP